MLIAFVTAWSLLGINRTVIWEMSFLHIGFVLPRVLITLPFPFLAGWVGARVLKMNILIGTIVLFALAGWVWQRLETGERRQETYRGAWHMLRTNPPRMMASLTSAELFAELLPQEIVHQYLGDTSGFQGVALGMVLGILTPGGAFVSFALAAGAIAAGATAPEMFAYLTAWALFSLARLMAEELAFLGPAFILRRVAVSVPIPLLVDGLALLWP